MAAITVVQPTDGRPAQSQVGEGQRGFKIWRGIGKFNSTDASGTLNLQGCTSVRDVQLTVVDQPAGIVQPANYPLGTVSATTNFSIIAPKTGTLVSAFFGAKDGQVADNSNNWAWGLINKGQAGAGTTVMIDNTANANITNVAGGLLNAYTARALVLSANSQAGTANDFLSFTMTKAGTATTQTESTLVLNFAVGGTDENLYPTVNSSGVVTLSSSAITINRTGNSKTSALKFAFFVIGH